MQNLYVLYDFVVNPACSFTIFNFRQQLLMLFHYWVKKIRFFIITITSV